MLASVHIKKQSRYLLNLRFLKFPNTVINPLHCIQLLISLVKEITAVGLGHTLLVPESRSVSFSISRRISLKSV